MPRKTPTGRSQNLPGAIPTDHNPPIVVSALDKLFHSSLLISGFNKIWFNKA